MDRLTAMEVFVRVVERGSFTVAAQELQLSRSMVSKHVQDLEQRMGVRLLNRTTRRLSATDAGRVFFDRCIRILLAVEDAEDITGEQQNQLRGLLRLNVPVFFGVRHLTPALADFTRRHAGVSVDMTLNDRVVDLIEEGYDLAVRIGRLADSSLIARRLAPCRFVTCASPGYLGERGEPATPEDLRQHNCLAYTYMALKDEWLFSGRDGDVAVRVSGNFRANNGDALRVAALSGQGITQAPSFLVGDDLKHGRLVPLLAGFQSPETGIYALYPPGRVSAKVRSLVAFLAARFGDDPEWDGWRDPAAAQRQPACWRA